MSELVIIFVYYLVWVLIGILGYFVIQTIFKGKFKIISYSISKPIGIIILGYPIWFLSSIKILNFNPNQNIQLIFYGLIVTLIAYKFIIKEINFLNWINKHKPILFKIILLELAGFVLYLSYLYIRAFNPGLNSTEKPMDILMLSSAGKTDFFPFFDPWWSEQIVNYYYYGFYLFAIIIKLINTEYTIGYNLSLGFIFSQTFIISGSIAYYLVKSIKAAIISGLLITLAGNLHYAYCLIQNRENNITSACYYPKATRILDPAYTINEITSYSFVLGDLHPHVLSLIFFLSSLLLIFIILTKQINSKYKFLLLALCLASTAMINFWDFFTLGIIYATIYVFLLVKSIKNKKFTIDLKKISIKETITKFLPEIKLLFISILLAVSPYVFFSPFFSHFKSPVEGIGFSPHYIAIMQQIGVEIKQYPSTFGFLFGIWGSFWIIFILSLGLKLFKIKKISTNLILLIVSFVIANLLILFTELFFFKDMFHYINPNYFRSNTVFKLTYHSWILMCIITGAIIIMALNKLEILKKQYNYKIFIATDILFSSIIILLLGAKLIYPFFAISQFYNPDFSLNTTRNLTLDGSIYVKKQNLADYEVIKWINKNQKERVVILEAVGSAYTYFGRISSNTGMGNVINWETHQWTWRFRYPENRSNYIDLLKNRDMKHIIEKIALRKYDVKTIYETNDIRTTKELLTRYDIKYVYIGDLEKQNYKINENKFYQIGNLVFEYKNSKLFLIPD